MNAQRLQDLVGARHVEASRQDPVERKVERVESSPVVGIDGRGLLLQVRRQRVLVSARHSSRGLRGDSPSNALRMKKRSRTSLIEISATNEPCCGATSTRRS